MNSNTVLMFAQNMLLFGVYPSMHLLRWKSQEICCHIQSSQQLHEGGALKILLIRLKTILLELPKIFYLILRCEANPMSLLTSGKHKSSER